jgi:hypothetical protein
MVNHGWVTAEEAIRFRGIHLNLILEDASQRVQHSWRFVLRGCSSKPLLLAHCCAKAMVLGHSLSLPAVQLPLSGL